MQLQSDKSRHQEGEGEGIIEYRVISNFAPLLPRISSHMAASRQLTPAQLTFLSSLLMEGCTTAQINKETVLFKPPFTITAAVATYYRRKLAVRHSRLIATAEVQGWADGLARKEERVRALKLLAERLLRDLLRTNEMKGEEKVWLSRLKGYGQGPQFFTQEYFEFNHQEVIQLRGILDDIAREMGSRSTKVEVTNTVSAQDSALRIPAEALSPDFLNVYRDMRAGGHTEYVMFGGRGSTKSSFASLAFIEFLVNNPDIHGLAMRQVANTCRDSVYSQLSWAIGQLGLSDRFKCIVNPLEIEYLPTHQRIYFRGADDPGKLKSIKPQFGYIGIMWMEELDQFHGPEAVRKIEQSAIRGGDLARIFKTFNPPRTSGNWVNKYIQIPKANQLLHSSSYLTVPHEWLGQVFIDEAEHLREVNPPAYEHEYLGEVNGMGGQVFENLVLREVTDDEIYGKLNPETNTREGGFEHLHDGIDWGFYPDPFVWLRSNYDAKTMTLTIFDEHRAVKKRNKDAWAEIVKLKNVKPASSGEAVLMIADSAEPKSVADFKEFGADIRGAEKGPESLTYSMKWLQSLRQIVIDPKRAPTTAQEFLDYELEQDKDGEYISEYPDKDNHSIDAARYATNLVWRRRGQ